MRWLFAFALALTTTTASAAVIDVKIYDAFGASYDTTHIAEQLGALYNISFDPTLVLILGPSLQDDRLREQHKIVAGIDPDEHGILFAIGTPQQTFSRGFSVTPNTAAELLDQKPGDFRVIVLGTRGRVLLDTQQVVPRERLLEIAPGG